MSPGQAVYNVIRNAFLTERLNAKHKKRATPRPWSDLPQCGCDTWERAADEAIRVKAESTRPSPQPLAWTTAPGLQTTPESPRMKPDDFHESNTATELLSKIGSGMADDDFARAIHKATDRVTETGKKAKVVLTVEINPVNKEDPSGGLILRAEVEAKLPKLPAAATVMHVGPKGQLMTQLNFVMDGGPSETRPQPLPDSRSSGRHQAIAKVPDPAPLAPAPNLAPLAGQKEAQP